MNTPLFDGREARIAAFAGRQGFDHIWHYLLANPTLLAARVANEIGGVSTSDITEATIKYCLANQHMVKYIRYAICKGLIDELAFFPAESKDALRSLGVCVGFSFRLTAVGTGLPEPYPLLLKAIAHQLDTMSLSGEWKPSGIDDPLLVEACDRAMDELPADVRDMIVSGKAIPKQPPAGYRRILDPIWDHINIYDGPTDFLKDFARVPAGAGHLFAAFWCQSEICNGGFHQFFTNSTGILAPEAVAGFVAIQMPRCADLIQQAMAFFGAQYPRDRATRVKALDAIAGGSRGEWDPFHILDGPFYEALDTESGGFKVAADEYAKQM